MAEPEVFEDAWINTNKDATKWIRVDPETGGLYRYNSGNGQYDIPLPMSISSITDLQDALDAKSNTDHTHDGLSDLPDIVTLLTGGVNGTKSVGGYSLTFTHGVLTNFEAE